MNKRNQQKGFTLLEILLVVAAIAILAAIVIVAINPTKQLGQTKNAQRRADVTTILNAVYQYAIDNNGALPVTLSTTSRNICKSDVATASICYGANGSMPTLATNAGTLPTDGAVYLGTLTNNELYLTSIPLDPLGASTTTTGYFIMKTITNRITVTAPYAESYDTNPVIISVTR